MLTTELLLLVAATRKGVVVSLAIPWNQIGVDGPRQSLDRQVRVFASFEFSGSECATWNCVTGCILTIL